MDETFLLTIADICQASIVPLTIAAYFPQWRKITENRSSTNISLYMYLLWTFGAILSAIYALTQILVYGTGAMLFITSLVNVSCLVVTVLLILRFRCNANIAAVDAEQFAIREIIRTTESTALMTATLRGSRNTAIKRVRKAAQTIRIGPVARDRAE